MYIKKKKIDSNDIIKWGGACINMYIKEKIY